jgi:hypothetical protein
MQEFMSRALSESKTIQIDLNSDIQTEVNESLAKCIILYVISIEPNSMGMLHLDEDLVKDLMSLTDNYAKNLQAKLSDYEYDSINKRLVKKK